MMILIYIAAFIVAIGILVTVHEFGHFWVAKKLGVKVLRFSIGFGRPIYSLRAGEDQTEYVIGAIPLGGYVRMLDERDGEVDPSELHRAFTQKSVWTRIAVVVAGPLFNFLFAILAYWAMFMVGDEAQKPYVGEIIPGTPAAIAGFQKKDLIVSVNEEPVISWEQLRMILLEKALDGEALVVRVRDEADRSQVRMLDFHGLKVLKEEGDFMNTIGAKPWRPNVPVIVEVNPGGAAERAGLKGGDRLLKVNGELADDARIWIKQIQASGDQTLRLEVSRAGEIHHLDLTPGEKLIEGKSVGFINAGIRGEITDEMAKLTAVTVRYGPWTAFKKGVVSTYDMSVLTLRLLGRLVVGEASIKNVSGPITIAQVAGISFMLGLAKFLSVLAAVSISLGVLNLLPVPILDGGHLLYYIVELIKGSPVSEHVQWIGFRIGAVMLGGLMILAFYNDLTRLFS